MNENERDFTLTRLLVTIRTETKLERATLAEVLEHVLKGTVVVGIILAGTKLATARRLASQSRLNVIV
jgi:hypothetical protein